MDPSVSINQMREIENEYPNFYNSDLPAFVCCTGQNCENNQENLKKVFTRICSKYFYVKNVNICKGIHNSRCQARVTYRMKVNDLPLEPDLKLHASFLLKHAPLNAVIIQEQRLLQLPKDVIVPYEIFCKCPMKFFDQAAEPSQMQPLIKQFQDLQA
ncbi:hypothetical protein TcasGA2_TC034226 [Tribolium castaneum]|uniref:Uncharacterized protein n=1 Tax=Tribolium castaneum TaxID=7070 RepID=A0A139WCS0_TRICA|nr:PREDICTED: uncharacterized protein LOC103314116 [Tribolium castaneum]KYB25665.1 hypothetical protein TcasGA2_TC034226 [Tribolium castaneum]|eukprot:XP_008197337.1 PREDICTED: uncharacterized protein LOC103314116 [Tribolium castaneum]